MKYKMGPFIIMKSPTLVLLMFICTMFFMFHVSNGDTDDFYFKPAFNYPAGRSGTQNTIPAVGKLYRISICILRCIGICIYAFLISLFCDTWPFGLVEPVILYQVQLIPP